MTNEPEPDILLGLIARLSTEDVPPGTLRAMCDVLDGYLSAQCSWVLNPGDELYIPADSSKTITVLRDSRTVSTHVHVKAGRGS